MSCMPPYPITVTPGGMPLSYHKSNDNNPHSLNFGNKVAQNLQRKALGLHIKENDIEVAPALSAMICTVNFDEIGIKQVVYLMPFAY